MVAVDYVVIFRCLVRIVSFVICFWQLVAFLKWKCKGKCTAQGEQHIELDEETKEETEQKMDGSKESHPPSDLKRKEDPAELQQSFELVSFPSQLTSIEENAEFSLIWGVVKKAWHVVGNRIYTDRVCKEKLLLGVAFCSAVGSAILDVIVASATGTLVDHASQADPDTLDYFLSVSYLIPLSVLCKGIRTYAWWLLAEILMQRTITIVTQSCRQEGRGVRNGEIIIQSIVGECTSMRYFYQLTLINCIVDVLTVTVCVLYALYIAFNVALLGIFLLPIAIPLKLGELLYAQEMNKEYGHKKNEAISRTLGTKTFEKSKNLQRIWDPALAIANKQCVWESLLRNATTFVTTIATAVFAVLAKDYPSEIFFQTFFFVGLALTSINDFSENVVFCFSTVALLNNALNVFVNAEDND